MIENMPNLIRLRNGDKVQNTFSAQEYANRMAKVRKHMVAQQIDAVLFTSYHNINYYSDFLYCSFGRFYGLAVTHDKTTVIAANIDGAQPWRKGVADDMLTYTDWRRAMFPGGAGLHSQQGPRRPGVRPPAGGPSQHAQKCPAQRRICEHWRGLHGHAHGQKRREEKIEFIANGAQVCDIGGAALVAAVKRGCPSTRWRWPPPTPWCARSPNATRTPS